MKVYTVEDKIYVSLEINEELKEIELKDVKNFEQDDLWTTITNTITKAIVNELDFNEIYKGIQTLINIYWNWQLCAFKNEDLSELSKYRYRYEIKIDDQILKLFFEWNELNVNKEEFKNKFWNRSFDVILQTIAKDVLNEIKKLEYTQLSETIKCACASGMGDIWDNI